MRRISVQEVIDAYKSTGRYPISGVFQNDDRGCCPVTACAKASGAMVAYHRLNNHNYMERLAESMGYSKEYLLSFIDGYDMKDFDPGRHLKEGYDDGFKCREEFPPLRDY
jgi:hypothetical protein